MKTNHNNRANKPDFRVEFIVRIYDDVMAVSKQSGFSWRFMLAQSALETGWGANVRNGTNNIFNIKADKSHKGDTIIVPGALEQRRTADNKIVTFREESSFCVYRSYSESIWHWLKFLESNPRYHGIGKRADGQPFINIFGPAIKSDLEKLANAMEHNGYATDQEGYARKIITIARGPTMRKALAEVDKRKGIQNLNSAPRGVTPPRDVPDSISKRWLLERIYDTITNRWPTQM